MSTSQTLSAAPNLTYKLYLPPNQSNKLVIISHPYGPLGGSSDDHVVQSIKNLFLGRGMKVVLIDFENTSWTGRRELKEYGNLLTHLLSNDSSISELIQIGYSYGCLVSSSFIPPPIIKSSHVFISYPLTFVPLLTLFSSYPKLNLSNLLKEGIQLLIIYGNQDEFTSQKSYDSWIEGLKKNDELKVVEIEGGNHFWNQKDQKNELLNRTDAFIDC